MTYTIKNSDWQWLIAPEPNSKRYVLKCKRPTEWTDCRSFDTPEAAASAVAEGKTGQKEWDDAKHDDFFANLASWLVDPMGIITEVLKATILPPAGGA
jgi:hypothetical protein